MNTMAQNGHVTCLRSAASGRKARPLDPGHLSLELALVAAVSHPFMTHAGLLASCITFSSLSCLSESGGPPGGSSGALEVWGLVSPTIRQRAGSGHTTYGHDWALNLVGNRGYMKLALLRVSAFCCLLHWSENHAQDFFI